MLVILSLCRLVDVESVQIIGLSGTQMGGDGVAVFGTYGKVQGDDTVAAVNGIEICRVRS